MIETVGRRTYKDFMRQIVLELQAGGVEPVLGKVPFVPGAPNHPNGMGYASMATLWHQALLEAGLLN